MKSFNNFQLERERKEKERERERERERKRKKKERIEAKVNYLFLRPTRIVFSLPHRPFYFVVGLFAGNGRQDSGDDVMNNT